MPRKRSLKPARSVLPEYQLADLPPELQEEMRKISEAIAIAMAEADAQAEK